MKSNILILGKGYIGDKLRSVLNCNISGAKIGSFKEAEKEILKYKPKVIINCIGHIGKNVDYCELDKDKTLFSNAFLPVILAEVALRNRMKLVHISSGCIYNYEYGVTKPITENKVPDFFNLFYSRSKIYSERALLPLADRYNILIARIRIPLDNVSHPKNILNKLINYKTVIDIPNSVTYIPDFVKAVRYLIKIDARGVYNIVNKGTLRYPKLLDEYRKYCPDFKYKLISYKKMGLVRTNLILSSAKLENTGFKVRNIDEVIPECVENFVKF
ncbi:MAG: sugar nucleotide-binding protein [Candidatus Omnitrophica bacterium]|nr:sugar nucleotide-binding protein [Candidatus Omnitrophota bacterium]